jgi:GH24 family phage-related lysozyme (muramidase)
MARNNILLFVAAAIAVGIIIISQNSNASPDTSTAALATGANMVSNAQLQATMQLEGFSPTAYADGTSNGQQLYSIGYGHQVQPSETSLLTSTITQAQGQQMFLNDVQPVVDTINNSGVQFTQGQFDAAFDYGYNAGVGALGTLINTFDQGGASAVAAWLPTSRITSSGIVNQGLINRRQQELATWNAGTPIATADVTASATTDNSTDPFLQYLTPDSNILT